MNELNMIIYESEYRNKTHDCSLHESASSCHADCGMNPDIITAIPRPMNNNNSSYPYTKSNIDRNDSKANNNRLLSVRTCTAWCMLLVLLSNNVCTLIVGVDGKLADRGRVVNFRKEASTASQQLNSRVHGINTKSHLKKEQLLVPIEGPKYRGKDRWEAHQSYQSRLRGSTSSTFSSQSQSTTTTIPSSTQNEYDFERHLGSQLTGCCTTYSSYDADTLCYKYGNNCNTGAEPSHDSGDGDCSMAGLSFIGISFSVNTPYGSPYSYQLCDQYPMENLIDRDYEYVMSMDEDGWLVGGGYKSFDYSGKMPYIDSSHTELLRIGSLDQAYGGTTIDQVYDAMGEISFPPFSVFPEYVKGGGKHHSGDNDDDSVPSGDVTLIVSIVETYEEQNNYSDYEIFLGNLFNAMDAVNGGPCMDDHDTDPHVSMARGVKFKSSYHQTQYFYKVNLEVAVWQYMYPKGVPIGSSGKANFPPNQAGKNQKYIGYGNLYFFFDRANITKAFAPNRDLTEDEEYYATITLKDYSEYYEKVNKINFDYSGSGSKNNNQYYEHNPYAWNAKMAKHDMTDGWDLPPNCLQEGETFLGIPLSRASSSKLQSSSSFQEQFDFEYLVDRNFTYMKKFGTNHGWLIGEIIGNAAGSIVDRDTSHIPLFYTGTTNPNMGGIALADLIKIVNSIDFGVLYIKPAFVFQDDDGAVKLQFEADSNSALGYLYDNLCKMLGLAWNYDSPYNKYEKYTNCAMHAAGDRASYGCGIGNGNKGGFCPQMTLAYRVNFQSEEAAAAFLSQGNNYVDYWRSLYPSGVAVGTNKFCKGGGCLGLFLNRYDLYQVFKPELGGSWVEYNGATFAPTTSPAPSADGGCDNPHNRHLDKCFRQAKRSSPSQVAWESLGPVGQLSFFLVSFMAVTLSLSIFLARARKRRKKGESYVGFFVRDLTEGSKKKAKRKKKKLRKKSKNKDLTEDLMGDTGDDGGRPRSSRSKSKSRRSTSRAPEGDSRSNRSKSRSRRSGFEEEEDEYARSSRSKSRSRRSGFEEEDMGRSSRSKSKSRRGGFEEEEDEYARPRSSSRRSKSRGSSRRSSSRSRRDYDDDYNRRQLV